ncbi:hypothetical protein F7725_004971 [Dissostichus mawsoni]|uniref:Uncharacterized protein n=1 Tax=Dissostichus mawsoni TaxID=36200 RepID=A0A7J5XLQ2_DISMA|nr:hypothetical protein F7725_004971 [Dissostichus mawsoni]
MVVVGAFISIGFSYAFPKSITVFFKEIEVIFDVTSSQVSWISSIMLAVMYGGGLGLSFNLNPSLTMIGKYFYKKRPIANGIAMAGGPVVLCTMAPINTWLFEKFGWRGRKLKDIYHDYKYTYQGCGILLIVSSVILFAGMGLNYRQLDKEKKRKRDWPGWKVSNGQVSAVRPQEVEETCGDFMAQQVISKGLKRTDHAISQYKHELPKIKAVSPMEKGENNCNPGQLYSKLFDEVEKVKCWKVKVDSDTLQKERRLQGNKRTIETQRKAIQELQRIILMILFALCVLSSQFGSESLSVKLEEQISENEDLRNKTWLQHLKAFVFKQKMINKRCKKKCPTAKQIAFMFSVKEALLQFEDLKEKYNQEYDMKEKESFKLKYGIRNMNYKTSCWTSMKTRSTANNSKKQQMNNVDFSVAQKLNKSPCFRNVSLRAALHRNRALAAILEQTKEEFTEMIQSKDSSLQGLRKDKTSKCVESMKEKIDVTEVKIKVQQLEGNCSQK